MKSSRAQFEQMFRDTKNRIASNPFVVAMSMVNEYLEGFGVNPRELSPKERREIALKCLGLTEDQRASVMKVHNQ